MKLYLIHVGFYDPELMDGLYEQHGNFFVVAKNVKEAKYRAKRIQMFQNKNMHIDGIQELNFVDGYRVNLVKETGTKETVNYSYDEVKKLK
tara:strand:- start:61 stop:333 length:273 start_codon:yes stop_codon:yes gene_type:complete